jgi:hypothetical protein
MVPSRRDIRSARRRKYERSEKFLFLTCTRPFLGPAYSLDSLRLACLNVSLLCPSLLLHFLLIRDLRSGLENNKGLL